MSMYTYIDIIIRSFECVHAINQLFSLVVIHVIMLAVNHPSMHVPPALMYISIYSDVIIFIYEFTNIFLYQHVSASSCELINTC